MVENKDFRIWVTLTQIQHGWCLQAANLHTASLIRKARVGQGTHSVRHPAVQNATKDSIQGSQEGRQQGKGRPYRGQEAQEEEEGILLHLHLQGLEAGAP